MIKMTPEQLDWLEQRYPGINRTIAFFDEAILPVCTICGSLDTANVQVGTVGRTIYLAGATTKFKLIPNGPKPGKYFCNNCKNFFSVDSIKEV